ncbi:ABC transporter-associated protein EcsC [Candidatus Formimonas warabiya]|uniref:ABC transporter-associated protein EcsC n=2 Tax=Formimonas warabiya TaxID=1761012 RepID=A0A3G1L0T9_FORW1|nr:ABC transporter-associated protein EcsC [Candidatus Formimonas warabiya]
MTRKPSLTGRLSKGWQNKVNNIIPEKVHAVLTNAIKHMVRAVLIGSEFITKSPLTEEMSFEAREALIQDKINFYKKAAAAEGAGTGAGGIFLGLADFPLLLSIKIKFLFDAAGLYGFDVRDVKERLYILYIFQLAFSSEKRRGEVYHHILHWDEWVKTLPASVDNIDWRLFQQEYRDYIDLAKMLQLVPGIGAFVGAYANYHLLDKLGVTAMNCYRMRLLLKNDEEKGDPLYPKE